MFIRVDRGRVPPQRLDAFASFMRNDITPQLRNLAGYQSTSMAIDRTNGMVSVTTAWNTSNHRDGSDQVLAAVLKNAPQYQLEPIKIEFYELAFVDDARITAAKRVSPP